MIDVQRQDKKLLIEELFRAQRLFVLLAVEAAVYIVGREIFSLNTVFPLAIAFLAPIAIWAFDAKKSAVRRRFYNRKYEALWAGCRDRLARLEDVLSKMRREQVADLTEMPKTIRRVGESLYLALRRADLISNEVQKTEQGMYMAPPVWQSPSEDPQAKELYRIADKNIAEYRAQFAGVMAGVHRAEAQSAVFMTTLDSLRMKVIGYRLVGKNPELTSHEFLTALGEAKLQLNAIDQALEELDFTQMPQMIAALPVQPPETRDQLQQG